jgi:uncharacterized protein
MTAFLAGLLLGVAGSGHCLVMCGPLVLAVERRASGNWIPSSMLVYHAGRLLTYQALAVAAGLAGRGLALDGLGRILSVACGVLILIAAAGVPRPAIAGRFRAAWSRALVQASMAAGRVTRTRPLSGQLLAGALNGLLPCGLAYTAAAAALALGGVTQAALFMAGFGSATLPALFSVSFSAAALPASVRARLRRAAPLALALTGILLIVRGLVPSTHIGSHHATFSMTPHRH